MFLISNNNKDCFKFSDFLGHILKHLPSLPPDRILGAPHTNSRAGNYSDNDYVQLFIFGGDDDSDGDGLLNRFSRSPCFP